MAHPVLITQCLQRDFVDPIADDAPVPNALHVGAAEARRLMGADPSTGPVAQLVAWARAQAPGALTVVHVRDWHDPDDPRQAEHLRTFGAHCVRDTPGAELVLGVGAEVPLRDDERFVDAIGLNDFEGTDLRALLDEVRARHGEELQVAVVGVWTDAKVSFLLYDLATRLGVTRLATCSALTASASRAQHFNALDQLEKLLGVRVFHSVGELGEWLVPEGPAVEPSAMVRGYRPDFGEAPLEEEDREILSFLYRDSAKVELTPLGGGFSGAAVFAARSRDAMGHEHAPSVAKLGTPALIGKERAAFERVQAILGNAAPAVLGFVDAGDRAGLKYAYAAMGEGEVRTLKGIYESGAPLEDVVRVLDRTFGEVLVRFSRAATLERLDLLACYQFSPRWAGSVGRRAAAVAGEGDPDARRLHRFYAEDLPRLAHPTGERHLVSYVHGDLNGANVLVDARDNVWLIDFFHTERTHALKDLVKLENDVLFLFADLADEGALGQGRRLVDALYDVDDLSRGLGGPPPGVDDPELLRAFGTIACLRSHLAELVAEDPHPVQLFVPALRYAAHTLGFDEASPLQKRLALYAAARHADAVTRLRGLA